MPVNRGGQDDRLGLPQAVAEGGELVVAFALLAEREDPPVGQVDLLEVLAGQELLKVLNGLPVAVLAGVDHHQRGCECVH